MSASTSKQVSSLVIASLRPGPDYGRPMPQVIDVGGSAMDEDTEAEVKGQLTWNDDTVMVSGAQCQLPLYPKKLLYLVLRL